MPVEDDIKPRNFVTDQIDTTKIYDGIVVAVEQDLDRSKDRYYVTWYLPELKGVIKEKGRGTMLQFTGAAKKLAIIFMYHTNFPGSDIEPVQKSNVFPTINRRKFDYEKPENWLGLAASLKFTEEPAYDKKTQTYDYTKMYKNIVRDFDPKKDGIQPNLNVARWTPDQVQKIVDEHLTEEEGATTTNGKSEDDLPF